MKVRTSSSQINANWGCFLLILMIQHPPLGKDLINNISIIVACQCQTIMAMTKQGSRCLILTLLMKQLITSHIGTASPLNIWKFDSFGNSCGLAMYTYVLQLKLQSHLFHSWTTKICNNKWDERNNGIMVNV